MALGDFTLKQQLGFNITLGGETPVTPTYYTYYDVIRNVFVGSWLTENNSAMSIRTDGSVNLINEFVEDDSLDMKFYFNGVNSMVARRFIEE